jgi:hypothetical protein
MSPEEAFVGSPSGKNLAKWQVEVDKGCDGFTHKMYNLCTLVSSDETDVDHTMADLGVMVRLMEHLSRGEPIVALGNKVSKILTANNIEHIPMPHPSPRNRQTSEFVVPELMARPRGDASASFKDFDDLDEARNFQQMLNALSTRYSQLYTSEKFVVSKSPAIIDRMGD